MPIKPQPFALDCPACGWTQVVAPESDVLLPGDWPSACPRCGDTALQRRQASRFERVFARLGKSLQR